MKITRDKTITFRPDPKQMDGLAKMAAKRKVTISDLIREAIDLLIKKSFKTK
jgi:hypothetical protein